jgi:hypothetical protein
MLLSRFTWPLWLMGLLTQAPAWAQGALHDPTSPPHGLAPRVSGVAASTVSGASSEAGAGPAQAKVQVLLIGPDRRHAVLDGRLLKTGEQLDQWRLVRIHANGVVLQSGQGSQTVSAFPGVSKKMIADVAAPVPPKKTKP